MSSTLSIDIGSNSVKVAVGEFRKSSLVLSKTMELPVPDYSVAKGRITNGALLANTINTALKNERIRTGNSVVTINAVGAVVRDLDFPKAKPKELEAMIRHEMVKSYHINDTDVLQYKPIETFVAENGGVMTTYRTVALDDEIVDEYYAFIKLLKIKSVTMDINMNCIDKLFQICSRVNDTLLEDKSTMFVEFGAKTTAVYLHFKGKQKFFRQLELGSDGIEKRIGDIALIQPEEVKKAKENGFDYFRGDTPDEQYSSILKPFFYELAEELKTIARYYASRYKTGPVEHVFLFGNGSKLNGLPEFLESSLSLPVQRIKSVNNIIGTVSESVLLTHLNAIGALIRR